MRKCERAIRAKKAAFLSDTGRFFVSYKAWIGCECGLDWRRMRAIEQAKHVGYNRLETTRNWGFFKRRTGRNEGECGRLYRQKKVGWNGLETMRNWDYFERRKRWIEGECGRFYMQENVGWNGLERVRNWDFFEPRKVRERHEVGLVWGAGGGGKGAKLGQNGGLFCNGSGVGEMGRSGGTEGGQKVRGRYVIILKNKLR